MIRLDKKGYEEYDMIGHALLTMEIPPGKFRYEAAATLFGISEQAGIDLCKEFDVDPRELHHD